MSRSILITGAGSGLGEGTAIGLARRGHHVIATVEVASQVTALRRKVEALGLTTVEVEKLNLLDLHDVSAALKCEIDVLVNNAGIGEGGPFSEMPADLVRRSFEINVISPMVLTQGIVARWVKEKKRGKVVFVSPASGLDAPIGIGVYFATRSALEVMAAAMRHELMPFGIKVQNIDPGVCLTGFNETMADAPFRWLDDERHFTKRATMREIFDSLLSCDAASRDPAAAIAQLVETIPA